MKTGNLNGVDLTSGGGGTNYLADDGTYKAVGGGGSQDLQDVIDQDPISTSYPIFKGDSLTGENLLTRYADNNEDSALDVKYDNTNNVFVFRIGDINARDIEVRNFNDKILTLATSAATDSFTAHKIATFEDDVVVENTSDNGITQLIGLDASNVVRQANVISHDIQQLNQPTAWVNGGFQNYYGTGSNPSGNIGVGLVQTANKAQLVAGAFGTATSNQLEIQAADASGVEQVVAIFKDNTINLPNLPTSSAGLSSGDLWNDSGTLKIV